MKIAPSHRSSIFHYAIIIMGVALLLEGSAPRCAAAAIRELSVENDPIPRKDYKSWSLFLISSPEWLLRQSNEKLDELYQQFRVFGNAIGSDNVAVWFWSHLPSSSEFRDAVDVPRSIAFCKRFNLNPSQGPYVLVMTKYPGQSILSDPDSFPKDTAHALVIKLNGNDAASTTKLLGNLADKLLTEDLSKLPSNSDDYWTGWRNVFTKVNTVVIGLSSKVTVAFNTGPVKTEIKLGP